jgi:hypothetical protein
MAIRYVGTRTETGCQVVRQVDGVETGQLDPRLDLWNHSPAGYVEFRVMPTFPRIPR